MVASSPQTDDSVDLREYVAVLSRRKWLILAFTVLFTGLALAYSFTADPVYTGVNEILLQPQVSSSQLRPDQLVSLETEARVVTSATVAKDAAATLGSEVPIPTLLKQVSVEITPETLVLDVMFDAPTPKEAADGANAFAAAYLEFKQDRAIEVLDSQRAVIDAQRIPIQDELRAVNDRLDELAEDDPIYQEKLDERDVLEGRLDLLDLQYLQIPAVPEEAGTSILPATPPPAPSSPNHKLNLAMGLVLGLFLGIVVAFVRDRVDDKVGDRGDLESLTTVLATIPRAALVGGGDRAVLVTEEQPRSPAAEAYRTLRTSVMAMRRQSGDSVFAIASPVLGDGKSTTAANLAAALSHADKRVLVMSADLRRPSLHRFFGKANDIGLAEVLLGEVRFGNAIQTVAPNLVLLSSGAPAARPAEILQSQAMRELIRREREKYDFILIDCPPVLGIADTVTIAPFVDCVIMVARAEKTKRSLFVESMDSLAQVGGVLGGAVINDVAAARGAYSYGYGPDTDKRRFGRKRKTKTKPKRTSKRKHREQEAAAKAAAASTKKSRPVAEPPASVDGAEKAKELRPVTRGSRPRGRSGK